MSSAGPAAKAALYAGLVTGYAAETDVQVSYGHPGASIADDMVAVMAVAAEQEPGPMRTGPRPREETLRITVTISCYRGGGPEIQATVTARAFALLTILEDFLAVDPTIAGTVRWAQLESYDMAEATDPDVLAAGRVAEIDAVVLANARNVPNPPT